MIPEIDSFAGENKIAATIEGINLTKEQVLLSIPRSFVIKEG